MTQAISIRGWDNFQHYKDRDPPWIKLYRDLLTSESWVLGTDSSRLLQVASLLLAARYKNLIPLQWSLIRKVASLDCSEKEFNSAVLHLCKTKFFEIQSLPDTEGEPVQDASAVLATCTSETEQSRAEGEQRQIARANARPAKRCPKDFELDAELRTWAAAKFPSVNADAETEAFRDHEFAKPRSDWPATWRTWIRNAAKFANGSGRPTAPKLTRYEQMQETLRNATET